MLATKTLHQLLIFAGQGSIYVAREREGNVVVEVFVEKNEQFLFFWVEMRHLSHFDELIVVCGWEVNENDVTLMYFRVCGTKTAHFAVFSD